MVRRSEQTFLQSSYTNGQQAHEKMLNRVKTTENTYVGLYPLVPGTNLL